jgi:hypothetical protein
MADTAGRSYGEAWSTFSYLLQRVDINGSEPRGQACRMSDGA